MADDPGTAWQMIQQTQRLCLYGLSLSPLDAGVPEPRSIEGSTDAAGSSVINLSTESSQAHCGHPLLRDRQSLRLDRWKRGLVPRVDAPRMPKAAGAVAGAAVGVGHDVVNDVVRAIGISRNPRHSEQVVQAQVVP